MQLIVHRPPHTKGFICIVWDIDSKFLNLDSISIEIVGPKWWKLEYYNHCYEYLSVNNLSLGPIEIQWCMFREE